MNNEWMISDYNKVTPKNNQQKNYEYTTDFKPVKTIKFLESPKTPKKLGANITAKVKKIKDYFYDYCVGTTLHGLKYVGLPENTLFERFFWIFSFIGAILFSAYFISNIYAKWGLSPIIVGINPQYQSVSDIPFPAITICNMNLARKTEAEKIMKGDDAPQRILLSDLCRSEIYEPSSNETILKQLTDWEYIKNFMLKVSQPCHDLLIDCKWRGYKISCRHIFNSALTDEGVCCTFNRVSNKYMFRSHYSSTDFNVTYPEDNVNWTPEDGYPPTAKNSTWPYRGAGPGEHVGLTVIMNISAEQYYCSSSNSVGLKIRLHSPVESPMIADYGFFIHPRKEVRVSLKPTMDQASLAIKEIPINKRQCYFSFERELLFYGTYTKTNCEIECLSNFTDDKCGCVPYYLPKERDDIICDKSQESCYKYAKTEMDTSQPPSILCGCLPACNEIQYGQEHSLGDISNAHLRRDVATLIEPKNVLHFLADLVYYVMNKESEEFPNKMNMLLLEVITQLGHRLVLQIIHATNLIILHFFYQAGQYRSFEKSELFGFTDFLSNSGGLLGLFLGFSFLSTVEILYHLTLRLWCISYKNFKKGKNTSKKTVVYPFTK